MEEKKELNPRRSKLMMFGANDGPDINRYLQESQGIMTALVWVPELKTFAGAIYGIHPEKKQGEGKGP